MSCMRSGEPKKPIEEVLRGLTIGALPEGWTPIDVVCVVKCLDPDGQPGWAIRQTESVNDHELLGTLVLEIETLKRDLLDEWEDD